MSNENILNNTRALVGLYPMDAFYESRCSLWQRGINEGIITQEEFDTAALYYGDLWYYTGD